MEDYLYSDIGETSNIHGEIGLINIPSSRILDGGNLKLHLVNSEPINSFFIIANPFNWMEVSLRYADINTRKYSPYKSFSGDQTFKDKSFNLKLNLIKETERFPGLSIGFRDFIGTGKFSSEYIVSSKKIGDFDFSVGLGWGSLSSNQGISNPFIDIDKSFANRLYKSKLGGNLEFGRWFRGEKASAFYGFEYLNKYSGLRFKMDYDSSNLQNIKKESNWSYGLSIPASRYVDINLFKHRGVDLGFSISYKANYSNDIVPKQEIIPTISFSQKDFESLSQNDQVFTGTINVLLKEFGIFTQEIYLEDNKIEFVINQSRYRNLNTASKRLLQLTREILSSREINDITITFQEGNVNTLSLNFPLERFLSYLDNYSSVPELENYLNVNNFYPPKINKIFQGEIKFPQYYWGIRPDLKNHVGAPEAFYSGQLGILLGGGINFDKRSFIESSISIAIFENLEQLRLKAWSRLPKVRSDIREYLKEKYALKSLSYTYVFDPVYSRNFLFFGGVKLGLFEEMYGGAGGSFLFRDVTKPWYLSANYYWVKQREFNQRFSFRQYETFTGHLSFTWETPLEGTKLILSGGRYLARDSGITINMAKTFKTGFTLGFFATKTDISAKEFGEGSFDKGIYFSIPLDIVSSGFRKNNARFVWKNLTKDGGAMVSGGLDLDGYVENTSSYSLRYFRDGLNK